MPAKAKHAKPMLVKMYQNVGPLFNLIFWYRLQVNSKYAQIQRRGVFHGLSRRICSTLLSWCGKATNKTPILEFTLRGYSSLVKLRMLQGFIIGVYHSQNSSGSSFVDLPGCQFWWQTRLKQLRCWRWVGNKLCPNKKPGIFRGRRSAAARPVKTFDPCRWWQTPHTTSIVIFWEGLLEMLTFFQDQLWWVPMAGLDNTSIHVFIGQNSMTLPRDQWPPFAFPWHIIYNMRNMRIIRMTNPCYLLAYSLYMILCLHSGHLMIRVATYTTPKMHVHMQNWRSTYTLIVAWC